jgi:hypothetical protein
LKADSVLSFVKLLSQTRAEGKEAEAELPPFSHSPHFHFCFNCHAKVKEINYLRPKALRQFKKSKVEACKSYSIQVSFTLNLRHAIWSIM